jgi:hypothetical protein
LEISNTIMKISLKYINKFIFEKHKTNPKIVAFGPREGLLNFTTYVLPYSDLKIDKLYSFKNYKENAKGILSKIYNGTVDGVIILDGSKSEEIYEFLINNGLESNKSLFRLYNIQE